MPTGGLLFGRIRGQATFGPLAEICGRTDTALEIVPAEGLVQLAAPSRPLTLFNQPLPRPTRRLLTSMRYAAYFSAPAISGSRKFANAPGPLRSLYVRLPACQVLGHSSNNLRSNPTELLPASVCDTSQIRGRCDSPVQQTSHAPRGSAEPFTGQVQARAGPLAYCDGRPQASFNRLATLRHPQTSLPQESPQKSCSLSPRVSNSHLAAKRP